MRSAFLVTFASACLVGSIEAIKTKNQQETMWWMTDEAAATPEPAAIEPTAEATGDSWWLIDEPAAETTTVDDPANISNDIGSALTFDSQDPLDILSGATAAESITSTDTAATSREPMTFTMSAPTETTTIPTPIEEADPELQQFFLMSDPVPESEPVVDARAEAEAAAALAQAQQEAMAAAIAQAEALAAAQAQAEQLAEL